MHKHTKGEWIATDEHCPNYESYQVSNGKEIVCHGLAAKNKSIVIAAPDLLASVEGMLESLNLIMKEMPECTAKGMCLGYFHGEYNKALDAIKKATT